MMFEKDQYTAGNYITFAKEIAEKSDGLLRCPIDDCIFPGHVYKSTESLRQHLLARHYRTDEERKAYYRTMRLRTQINKQKDKTALKQKINVPAPTVSVTTEHQEALLIRFCPCCGTDLSELQAALIILSQKG